MHSFLEVLIQSRESTSECNTKDMKILMTSLERAVPVVPARLNILSLIENVGLLPVSTFHSDGYNGRTMDVIEGRDSREGPPHLAQISDEKKQAHKMIGYLMQGHVGSRKKHLGRKWEGGVE